MHGERSAADADVKFLLPAIVLHEEWGRPNMSTDGTTSQKVNAAPDVCVIMQIFPKMKNYTPYNRATSVGNQLLNNYRKFLLNYEICHRSRDLGGPIATPSAVTEVSSDFRPFGAHPRQLRKTELKLHRSLTVLASAAAGLGSVLGCA